MQVSIHCGVNHNFYCGQKDSGIVIHGLHKITKKTKRTYSKVCLWETADLEKCRQGLTLLSELTQLMPALLSGKPQ